MDARKVEHANGVLEDKLNSKEKALTQKTHDVANLQRRVEELTKGKEEADKFGKRFESESKMLSKKVTALMNEVTELKSQNELLEALSSKKGKKGKKAADKSKAAKADGASGDANGVAAKKFERQRLLNGELSMYDPEALGRGASVDVPSLEDTLVTVHAVLCAVVARYRASHSAASPCLEPNELQRVIETHFLDSTNCDRAGMRTDMVAFLSGVRLHSAENPTVGLFAAIVGIVDPHAGGAGLADFVAQLLALTFSASDADEPELRAALEAPEETAVPAEYMKRAIFGGKTAMRADPASWQTPFLASVCDPAAIRSLADGLENLAGGKKGTLPFGRFLTLATRFYLEAAEERIGQLEDCFVEADLSEAPSFGEFRTAFSLEATPLSTVDAVRASISPDAPLPAIDPCLLCAMFKLLTDLSGDAEDLVDARLFACICRRFGVCASKSPLTLTFDPDRGAWCMSPS